jgi:hypothetical protein
MATSPKDRKFRLGQPSLFRPLVIAAVGIALVLAIFVVFVAGEEPGSEEADMADDGAVAAANESVDGQGAEPEGIGGSRDPGVFADAPTPLAEGSSPNATSATQGDEMLDRPPNPPGGGRVDPEETGALAGEIAEGEEVPDTVRESDVRTALPEGEGSGETADSATEDNGSERGQDSPDAATGSASPDDDAARDGATDADDASGEGQAVD